MFDYLEEKYDSLDELLNEVQAMYDSMSQIRGMLARYDDAGTQVKAELMNEMQVRARQVYNSLSEMRRNFTPLRVYRVSINVVHRVEVNVEAKDESAARNMADTHVGNNIELDMCGSHQYLECMYREVCNVSLAEGEEPDLT